MTSSSHSVQSMPESVGMRKFLKFGSSFDWVERIMVGG